MASHENESIALGPYAPWIGPGIFALAIAAYLAVAAFEWHVVTSRPETHALSAATYGAHASSLEYVAHVHWRASALLLIGAGVAAVVVSTMMAAAHWRRAAPQFAAMAVLVALVAFIQNQIGGGDPAVWLQTHGLTLSWQGQLANIGALLAPLASTLVAQVLSSMT